MIRGIDHLVVLVDELEQAIADYTALGFTVVRGGDHRGGWSHNALVAFADGAYLELIAFKQPTEQHPWWRKGQRGGEGLVDYALLPSDTEQDVADARARGLELDGPTAGGRTRPDGEKLQWQTADSDIEDLPFLCGDITPRSLRVPEGEARRHANGVLGVAGVTVAVADLEASARRYGALLGEAASLTPPVALAGLDIRVVGLRLGTVQIALVSPYGDGGPAGAALRERLATGGEGPYAVALVAAPGARAGLLDQGLAHRAQLELLVDSPAA